MVWDDSARRCACGLKGCIEAYAGGEQLSRRARAELAGGARSAAIDLAGSIEAVNPGHLDAAAAEGDDYALGLWAEVGPLLGVVLANAVRLFNPQRLILGGGVLSRTPVLREHAIAALQVAVNPPALGVARDRERDPGRRRGAGGQRAARLRVSSRPAPIRDTFECRFGEMRAAGGLTRPAWRH